MQNFLYIITLKTKLNKEEGKKKRERNKNGENKKNEKKGKKEVKYENAAQRLFFNMADVREARMFLVAS